MVDSRERDTEPEPGSAGVEDTADGTVADGGEPNDRERASEHDHEHGHAGTAIADIGVAVVTVSSTRTREEDASGDAIVAACADAGASIDDRRLVPDDHDRIQDAVDELTDRPSIDAVVTAGGTGVTPDDVTVDAVRALFGAELPGFGELFRRYSEAEIGTRVVATRATAGIVDGVPVFCLPGSENAARLGTEEIVIPEVTHLVGLAGSDES